MPIIDCHALLGVWPQAEVELSVEALAAGMQARGISRSLVTHTTAIFYDASLGNDQARQLCSQYEPLEPVAVLNPLRYPRCLEEIERCLGLGIRVFRFCPREHGYPFSGAVGPLREALRALQPAKLLLVDLAGAPAPVLTPDLAELLPVPTAVAVDAEGLGCLIQAGRQGANLCVDTASLEAGGTIEAAVRHLGANRVVFGSRAPLRAIGSAVMSVQYAELSDEERAAIFEGNVQRVLG